ncbi:unnamed protein product [Sphagnum tenellum]
MRPAARWSTRRSTGWGGGKEAPGRVCSKPWRWRACCGVVRVGRDPLLLLRFSVYLSVCLCASCFRGLDSVFDADASLMWRIGEKERRDLSRFGERDLKAFLVDKTRKIWRKVYLGDFCASRPCRCWPEIGESGGISKVSDNEVMMLACQMHQNRAIGSEFALF